MQASCCFPVAVVGAKRFARDWLPVVLWMAVIFTASTDLLSNQNTSRFIGPLLRWLKPGISEKTVRQVQWLVRKTGHLAEYAVLALLLHRALRGSRDQTARRDWCWATAARVMLLTTLYAATDEIHQGFVASRSASGWDVLIDSLGATVGLGVVWLRGRLPRQKESCRA